MEIDSPHGVAYLVSVLLMRFHQNNDSSRSLHVVLLKLTSASKKRYVLLYSVNLRELINFLEASIEIYKCIYFH